MGIKFANNAVSSLSSGISNTATSITIAAGNGSLFPSLTGGDYFYATLMDTSNNLEIVKVTNRTGDTMTIVRGQDNTSPRAYSAGDRVELRLTTAGLMAAIAEAVDAHAARTNNPHNVTAAQVGAPTVSAVTALTDGLAHDIDVIQEALPGKADAGHTHPIADVSSLQSVLDGKAVAGHTHTSDDVLGLSDTYLHAVYNNDEFVGTNAGNGYKLVDAILTQDGGALRLTRRYQYI